MKRTIMLLAVFSLCQLAVLGQKKYEMVIEKTDGSEISINTADIVKTYFREVSSGSQTNLSLAGHTWCYGSTEAKALDNPNSLEGYVFNTDGTCTYFAVYNNGKSKEKRTGSYTYVGNVLTITTTTSYAWSNSAWSLQTGFNGKTRVYNVSISGNCMTWTGDDNETLYTREGFSVDLG